MERTNKIFNFRTRGKRAVAGVFHIEATTKSSCFRVGAVMTTSIRFHTLFIIPRADQKSQVKSAGEGVFNNRWGNTKYCSQPNTCKTPICLIRHRTMRSSIRTGRAVRYCSAYRQRSIPECLRRSSSAAARWWSRRIRNSPFLRRARRCARRAGF